MGLAILVLFKYLWASRSVSPCSSAENVDPWKTSESLVEAWMCWSAFSHSTVDACSWWTVIVSSPRCWSRLILHAWSRAGSEQTFSVGSVSLQSTPSSLHGSDSHTDKSKRVKKKKKFSIKFSVFKIMIATCQEHIIVSRIHQKNASREISLQYLIILPHRHLWGRCLKAMRLSL